MLVAAVRLAPLAAQPSPAQATVRRRAPATPGSPRAFAPSTNGATPSPANSTPYRRREPDARAV